MSRKVSKKDHVLKGTYQPHRHDPKKAKMPLNRPEAPAHLSDQAKEYFNQVADQLEALGILCLADKFILELTACTLDEYAELSQFIKDNGRTYQNETMAGAINVKAYPEAAMHQDCGKRLFSLYKELGLTSQAREKLPIEPEKKGGRLAALMAKDPFEAYMADVEKRGNRFEGH